MHDFFADYHPMVNFIYFISVMIYTMVFIHPICVVISMSVSFSYAIYLKRRNAISFNLKFMLPMLIFATLLNPLFNHRGMTILTYFPNGNPLTLESIIYGLVAASVLVTMISWFSCCNAVITSDKFIYLFGRILPTMSLFISMILRFVPLFSEKLEEVRKAQKCLGRDITDGSKPEKIKNAAAIFSIMITWMLENSIDTADSMKSRGYGLSGRTAYSIFIFSRRDQNVTIILILINLYILVGTFSGITAFRYFPNIKGAEISIYSISVFTVYLLLCAFPLILNGLEELKWKPIKSKI